MLNIDWGEKEKENLNQCVLKQNVCRWLHTGILNDLMIVKMYVKIIRHVWGNIVVQWLALSLHRKIVLVLNCP